MNIYVLISLDLVSGTSGCRTSQETQAVAVWAWPGFLRLGTNTANCLALGELGRKRLACTIKERMINFWVRRESQLKSPACCSLL